MPQSRKREGRMSRMADFTSKDYTSDDFRKEEHLFSRFYSDEISSAPGITWCTEYFYRTPS